jgi:hypothetical protein
MLEESDRQEKEEVKSHRQMERERAVHRKEEEKKKAAAKKMAGGHYVELDLSGDEEQDVDDADDKPMSEDQDDLSDALGFDDDDEDDY